MTVRRTVARESRLMRRCQPGACYPGLHPLVLRSAPSLARGPPWAQHVRGLTVDAVRGIHPQGALPHFVDSGRAHPGVELGHRGRHIIPYHEMDRNGVARRVSRSEDTIDLRKRETGVGGDP